MHILIIKTQNSVDVWSFASSKKCWERVKKHTEVIEVQESIGPIRLSSNLASNESKNTKMNSTLKRAACDEYETNVP